MSKDKLRRALGIFPTKISDHVGNVFVFVKIDGNRGVYKYLNGIGSHAYTMEVFENYLERKLIRIL